MKRDVSPGVVLPYHLIFAATSASWSGQGLLHFPRLRHPGFHLTSRSWKVVPALQHLRRFLLQPSTRPRTRTQAVEVESASWFTWTLSMKCVELDELACFCSNIPKDLFVQLDFPRRTSSRLWKSIGKLQLMNCTWAVLFCDWHAYEAYITMNKGIRFQKLQLINSKF